MSVTARELAERTRRAHNVRISEPQARLFLADWLRAGVVEPVPGFPGRFRLSASGRAMFSGWAGVGADEEAGGA